MLPYDLGRAACVCRKWRYTVRNPVFWRNACLKAWQTAGVIENYRILQSKYDGSWRKMWLLRSRVRTDGKSFLLNLPASRDSKCQMIDRCIPWLTSTLLLSIFLHQSGLIFSYTFKMVYLLNSQVFMWVGTLTFELELRSGRLQIQFTL